LVGELSPHLQPSYVVNSFILFLKLIALGNFSVDRKERAIVGIRIFFLKAHTRNCWSKIIESTILYFVIEEKQMELDLDTYNFQCNKLKE